MKALFFLLLSSLNHIRIRISLLEAYFFSFFVSVCTTSVAFIDMYYVITYTLPKGALLFHILLWTLGSPRRHSRQNLLRLISAVVLNSEKLYGVLSVIELV